MQQDTINEVIKKSKLNAKDAFSLEKLLYNRNMFLPVTYEEAKEEIVFTYDVTGMKNVSNLEKEAVQDRYKFLINFGRLEEIWMDYKFSLTPENIYYDENFIPYIKRRDIYLDGEKGDRNEFLNLYKTYIGGILSNKYEISSLQQSGIEVLKKETSFSTFYDSGTALEIMETLRERRDFFIQREQHEKISISRKKNILKNIVSIMAPVMFFIVTALFIWVYFFRLMDSETVVSAMEAYVQSDYINCINSLKEVEMEDMDKSTKYVLAVSYAKTESLKKEEIAGIVSRLSINSDERELEYWIALGRLDTERAEELSKALSDDQLLIYAYMKELNLLQQDTSMSGSDKQSRIEELESNIQSLGDKYIQDEGADETEADFNEATSSDAVGE